MSPIEFRAPWSKRLKVTTAVAVAMLSVLVVWGFVFGAHFGPPMRAVAVGVPMLLLVVPPIFGVRGYSLTQDEILVRRFGWTTRLPLAGLQSVDGKADAMQRSWKLFGNAGFFCYTGVYWSRQLGFYRAYATDPSRAVILRYAGRKILITPHDPQHFIVRARTLAGTGVFRV
jgi:hypothetical protein